MAKLTDLKARFFRAPAPRQREFVDNLAEADGVFFLEPRALAAGHEHGVLVRFDGRPDSFERPGPRHVVSGSGLEDLTIEGAFIAGGRRYTIANGEVA